MGCCGGSIIVRGDDGIIIIIGGDGIIIIIGGDDGVAHVHRIGIGSRNQKSR